jgi:outer membrane protein
MTRIILRAGAACGLALVLAAPLAAQAAPTLGPRPLTLDEAMHLAVPASEELKISQSQVMYANGEVKRSYSEFLPQLTITGTYLHLLKSQYDVKIDSSITTSCPAFTPVPSNPTGQRLDSLETQVSCLSTLDPFASLGFLPFARPNQYNIGVTLGWTIFNGSIVNGRTRAAKSGRKLADFGITTTQAQLMLTVTQAYFDAALADQLVTIAQDALDQADTTLKQAELGLKVGSQAEFEVLRARVARDNTRVVVIQRRSDRDIAQYRLRQLLELPLDQPLELTTPLADPSADSLTFPEQVAVSAQDTLTEQRMPVRQAVETATIQEILYKIAAAEWWPTLTVNSRFGQLAYPTGVFPGTSEFRTDWNVGLTLNFPIWTSGRTRGDAMVAQANFDQSKFRILQARKLAALDSRQVISRVQAAQAAWIASRGTAQQAERAYAIAEVRYREGLSSQTELTDIRLALAQARANSAVAARDWQVARTRLQLLPDLPFGLGTGGDASQSVDLTANLTAPATTARPATAGGTGTTP